MVPCVVIVKAGKRSYRVPGELPNDAPSAAEKQAVGAAALAACVATKGAGYNYTDAEPDWGTAVAQSVEWTKSANV